VKTGAGLLLREQKIAVGRRERKGDPAKKEHLAPLKLIAIRAGKFGLDVTDLSHC
jgi:hypothetical protein